MLNEILCNIYEIHLRQQWKYGSAGVLSLLFFIRWEKSREQVVRCCLDFSYGGEDNACSVRRVFYCRSMSVSGGDDFCGLLKQSASIQG